MSESVAAAGHASAGKPAMSVFERFLTFWVALCIIVGIALGQLLPGVFHTLGEATVAQVNIPVAVLVWLMIVPMLLKIDLTALGQVGRHWRGIASTVGVNWLVKPFTMAVLAWIFIAHLFRPWLPADWRRGFDFVAPWGLLAFIGLLFNPRLNRLFFDFVDGLAAAVGLPADRYALGWQLFRFWTDR